MYVVIGTSPSVDTSVAAGPFRSNATALAAGEKLTGKGYNTEVCPMFPVDEIPKATEASDE